MTSSANVHRFKVPMLIGGAIATALGIAVSWQTLGLARPAFFPTDLKPLIERIGNVEDLIRTNRQFILQLEWWRLQRQILDIEDALVVEGITNGRARQLLRVKTELQNRQRTIDRELGASFAPHASEAYPR